MKFIFFIVRFFHLSMNGIFLLSRIRWKKNFNFGVHKYRNICILSRRRKLSRIRNAHESFEVFLNLKKLNV